jgi:cytochrome c peroxidase
MSPFIGNAKRSLRHSVKPAALLSMVSGAVLEALAQENLPDPTNHAWRAGAIRHAQQMRDYFDPDRDWQATPSVIPGFGTDFEASGLIATAQPGGETQTSQNAFFANLGTNGRTCFTCHQPQNGWSVSAASVQARFNASHGTDPIFRLVDGATCPSDNVSDIGAKFKAYSLLLNKGLIRIGLPVPATIPGSTAPIEHRIISVSDPYGCNTSPTTGLTTLGIANPTAGIVSVYRRPVPATNLGFLTAIMWDGREPTLAQQSIDATLGHAQANAAPTTTQQQQIVNCNSTISRRNS